MTKKVMALLMAALLMLALAGCGENKNNTNRPGSNSNNTTNGSNDADKGNGTVNDGLTDAFNNYHMGITAENVCDQWGQRQ